MAYCVYAGALWFKYESVGACAIDVDTNGAWYRLGEIDGAAPLVLIGASVPALVMRAGCATGGSAATCIDFVVVVDAGIWPAESGRWTY